MQQRKRKGAKGHTETFTAVTNVWLECSYSTIILRRLETNIPTFCMRTNEPILTKPNSKIHVRIYSTIKGYISWKKSMCGGCRMSKAESTCNKQKIWTSYNSEEKLFQIQYRFNQEQQEAYYHSHIPIIRLSASSVHDCLYAYYFAHFFKCTLTFFNITNRARVVDSKESSIITWDVRIKCTRVFSTVHFNNT